MGRSGLRDSPTQQMLLLSDDLAFTGETNWFERQLATNSKELKAASIAMVMV